MQLAKRRTLIFSILLIAGLLALQGCSANGYITASVQSVIGLDVSENPQTQMPHVRFGFIRNQLYYVPTGKVVVGQGSSSGAACEAPALVSSIKLTSTFAQSMDIEEKFAIGGAAMNSPAGQALFVPPGTPVIKPQGELYNLQSKLDGLVVQNSDKRKKAKSWIETNFPDHPDKDSPSAFIWNPPDPKMETLQKLLSILG